MYRVIDYIINGEHMDLTGKLLVLKENDVYKDVSKSNEISTIIKKDNLIYEFVYDILNSNTTVIIYSKLN